MEWYWDSASSKCWQACHILRRSLLFINIHSFTTLISNIYITTCNSQKPMDLYLSLLLAALCFCVGFILGLICDCSRESRPQNANVLHNVQPVRPNLARDVAQPRNISDMLYPYRVEDQINQINVRPCQACKNDRSWFFPQDLPLCHNLKRDFCSRNPCHYRHYEDRRQGPRPNLFQFVDILESTRHELLIAVFAVTSIPLTKILRQINKKIACLRVITEAKNLTADSSKIRDLVYDGIRVRVNRNKCMHHKFAVLDKKVFIRGSFNWSHYAANVQYELLEMTEQSDKVEASLQAFETMWRDPGFVDVTMGDFPERSWGLTQTSPAIYSRKLSYSSTFAPPCTCSARSFAGVQVVACGAVVMFDDRVGRPSQQTSFDYQDRSVLLWSLTNPYLRSMPATGNLSNKFNEDFCGRSVCH